MAVYATDFQGGGTFEPVDPPVFLGIEPLLLALLVAIGAILFGLGWMLRNSQTGRDTDAAERIWKAVDEALKAAMKADGGALLGKAQDVDRVIRQQLGATLAVGSGLTTWLDPLSKALEGQRPVSHDHPHDEEPHGHDEGHEGDDAGEHAETTHSGAVTQITVVNAGATHATGSRRHGRGSHGGDGHGASLTRREQDHALRAAIADLNDHWRLKSERIGEMRAAHRELSSD